MSAKQSIEPDFTQDDGEGVRRFAESTMLKRLWYFDGRFLDAADFRSEQNYVRNLSALSNQANGHGVVHGLDVARSKSGLGVTAGLAINADGDVILLPEAVDLDVAQLIGAVERPTPAAPKSPSLTKQPPPKRTADSERPNEFTPCSTRAKEADTDEVQPATGYWVLSAAPANTLCGEEESFANPCATACETGTDRSFVLEGVSFRVRRYSPGIDVSKESDDQVRGAVASAWFKAERDRRRRKMSASVLDDRFWCEGATVVSGNEVDLAIFCRQGGSTRWVDEWTVRRELCESSPKNHWFHAMDMRPWGEFIAQVNQFQCQLADCLERRAVTRYAPEFEQFVSDVKKIETLASEVSEAHRQSFRQVTSSLTSSAPLLFAAADSSPQLEKCVGLTLPPCGWLPLVKGSGACASTVTWLGDGVIIERYLTVRRDYIGQAFQEAQHLDRISLAQNVKVDILIPEGSKEGADNDWFFFVRHHEPSEHLCGDRPVESGADEALEEVFMATFSAASASMYKMLPGIAEKRATAMVLNRTKTGPLTSVEQIAEISGMGVEGAGAVMQDWRSRHDIAAMDKLSMTMFDVELQALAADSSKQGTERRGLFADEALKNHLVDVTKKHTSVGSE